MVSASRASASDGSPIRIVADRGAGGFIGVGGDGPQFGARGQVVTFREFVVAEDRGAERHDEVVPFEAARDAGDVGGQDAPVARVPGGERAP